MGASNASAASYAVVGDGSDIPSWVGRVIEVVAPYPVEAGRVADYCSVLEDANPVYWDERAAEGRFGGPVAPPGTLTAWRQASPWHPGGRPPHGPVIAAEVPLPADTLINVAFVSEFHRPIRVGDRLTYTDRVVSISEQKVTALGRGHFIDSACVVTNQDGARIADYRNTMLRYRAGTESKRRAGPAPAPERPNEVPEVVLPVTATLCTLDVAATRDYFPGHHDSEYARGQGVPAAYPNTGFYCGLVDRVAVEWAGFQAMVVGRDLRMHTPAEIGRTLRTGGHVVERRIAGGRKITDLRIQVTADGSLAATALVSVADYEKGA